MPFPFTDFSGCTAAGASRVHKRLVTYCDTWTNISVFMCRVQLLEIRLTLWWTQEIGPFCVWSIMIAFLTRYYSQKVEYESWEAFHTEKKVRHICPTVHIDHFLQGQHYVTSLPASNSSWLPVTEAACVYTSTLYKQHVLHVFVNFTKHPFYCSIFQGQLIITTVLTNRMLHGVSKAFLLCA